MWRRGTEFVVRAEAAEINKMLKDRTSAAGGMEETTVRR